MTFTLIKPIEKAERARFIPVHRDYNQPNYNSNQQQKRNDSKEKQLPPVKSVKQDKKTGDLIIKYENGVEKRYGQNDPNRSIAEESLRYQNYSTNFDFKA